MQFSLLFFPKISEKCELRHPYSFLLDVCKFIDRPPFTAVWLPERHFDQMGGMYPNPAILGAVLASSTKHIRLRAGSSILPLHHPATIVEDWSVVDNLSDGRVDLAFASGWNVNDFVLATDKDYSNRRTEWIERANIVKKLWAGESVCFKNGRGDLVPITVYPRPVQPELSYWLAVSKNIESFQMAGTIGANVLTMLSGITLEQLEEKISVYREARENSGLDPESGIITLMLHTYVHSDTEKVDRVVRQPFMNYIKDSLRSHVQGGADALVGLQRERDVERMATYSFERYFSTGALFGDMSSCMDMVSRAERVGVNEIACMVDFGPTERQVFEGLEYLTELARRTSSVIYE